MNKDVRKLVQSISAIDGVEVRDGGKHLLVYRDDKRVTVLPKTPSDVRWRDNAVADLKRLGITPGVKLNGTAAPVIAPLMPLDELRARVAALPSLTGFARFMEDDALASNLRFYKNEKSAASALGIFRDGGGLTSWGHELLDHSIRSWDRVAGQVARFERSVLPEVVVPEPLVLSDPGSEADGIVVRVDVEKLSAALAAFGITLEVT